MFRPLRKQLPECVQSLSMEPQRAGTVFVLLFHTRFNQPNETQSFGEEQLFTVDAGMLFVRLTHHQYMRLSSCCCFLEISKTGRTLSSAERGEREASGLPGQRTGRDI